MKKLLYTLSSVAMLTVSAFAQQPPNANFEGTWANTPAIPTAFDEPAGWGTTNSLILLALFDNKTPGGVTISKETASPYAGSNSLKIVTRANYTPSYLEINDTAGFAFVGKVQQATPYLVSGYPMTTQYKSLEFYAKYQPVGSDKGGCIVLFSKMNGAVRDTIAYGTAIINSSSTFTKYTLDLTYKSSTLPDSASVLFSSSLNDGPQVGSTLYIDNIAFTGSVASIANYSELLNRLEVYPNPAIDNVTIKSVVRDQYLNAVDVFDVTGKKVTSVTALGNTANISLSNYPAGFYTYNAFNDKKELIGIGKFNVVK